MFADAVRVTLGPKSKCVLIGKKWGRPVVCNDGVTIAKEVEIKDAGENLGAQMIREAAERTGDVVGDGTTTSTILAFAMLSEGVRNVAAGASAIDLKRGIDIGVKAAVEAEAAKYTGDQHTGIMILKKAVALENAASAAGTLLLAEATMTEVEEPKPERQRALDAA
jgi:chaperonin GroEL